MPNIRPMGIDQLIKSRIAASQSVRECGFSPLERFYHRDLNHAIALGMTNDK
jgi:hypothetical protein